MHIVNCLHPRYVTNLQTGEQVRVRCGKCAACLNARAKFWINKLLQENEHNRYAFMVNLTYDNEHVPSLIYKKDLDAVVYKNRALDLCIPFSELTSLINEQYLSLNPCESLEDYAKRVNDQKRKDLEYLVSRLNHRLGLPVCCSDDISKFNKRLNKYIHDHITGQYQNFRFFLCHEYGPSTYRPHCHAIYFFNSRQLAKDFDKIISKAWSLGNTSVACIFSKGGFSYVAQYVNMSCHLPSFYSHKNLKARYQFSKQPPIGFVPLSPADLREFYIRPAVKRSVWDPASGKYSIVPVNATFTNRFFPKFAGYNRIDDYDRIKLYRSAEIFPSTEYEEFRTQIHSYVNTDKLSSSAFTSAERFIIDWCRQLHINSRDPRLVDMQLRKLYNVSCRFIAIRNSLNCSSEWLCERISNFYKLVDYEKLIDMYRFQQSYCEMNPVQDLISMYPEFALYWSKFESPEHSDNVTYNLALFSFGVDIYSLDSIDYARTKDYESMTAVCDKIYKDSHKRQDINNYRYSQRFHNLDSDLQKIILNYAT